jgi:murein L,D-transpeptidase YcbB/YkuD
VNVTEDVGASDRSLNKDVEVEASLAETERTLARNVKLYEAGKTAEAQASNAAVIGELKAKNATLNDSRIARKIESMNVEQNQMSEMAVAAPEAKQNYLKATKQRLYQAKSGGRSGDALQPGDKGLAVEALQKALAAAGFYRGKITGAYDSATQAAVKAYQTSKNIAADGIAGASTQAALGLY